MNEFNYNPDIMNYLRFGDMQGGGYSTSSTPNYSMQGGGFGATTTPSYMDTMSKYGSGITSGLQAAAGIWSAYNGMQQTKLAKQQMANSLAQWNKNYNNQVQTYNTQLQDRAQARYNANPNNPTPEAYMNANRLK